MNKPIDNAEGLVVYHRAETLKKLRAFVVGHQSPAEALCALLDYGDDYTFSVDDCALAVEHGGVVLRSMLNLVFLKHYKGARTGNPGSSHLRLISEQYIASKHAEIGRKLFRLKGGC